MKLLTPFVVTTPQPAAPPAIAETPEELIALKERFAELSLREPEPFKVALVLFPNDTSRALRIAAEWPNDPQVITLRQSFVDAEDDGETAFLPSKAELARLIWTLANRDDLPPEVRDSRIKALRAYGDVRGFIEKPAINNVNNNTSVQVNRVMVVKTHGEDWERMAVEQQTLLRKEVSVSANGNR